MKKKTTKKGIAPVFKAKEYFVAVRFPTEGNQIYAFPTKRDMNAFIKHLHNSGYEYAVSFGEAV